MVLGFLRKNRASLVQGKQHHTTLKVSLDRCKPTIGYRVNNFWWNEYEDDRVII